MKIAETESKADMGSQAEVTFSIDHKSVLFENYHQLGKLSK
jgi:hypothetical protein